MKRFSDLRQFFPILQSEVCGGKATKEDKFNKILLDNAATSQKPEQVIDRIAYYYKCENASVHRGLYSAAEQATRLYEQARTEIANFISANPDEIIFVKGATEAINFVASTWGRKKFSRRR